MTKEHIYKPEEEIIEGELIEEPNKSIQDHDFRHMRHPTAQKPAELIAAIDGAQFVVAHKGVLSVVPHADMRVTA